MTPPEGSEQRAGRPLFTCMVGLVLLNVVFVQLTEAASAGRLVPVYALTLAAPLLARFREIRLYRALWNIGVIAFLGVLIQHALGGDLAMLLQDGMVLALLCQVHLLNNLHEHQRPDLLFLNSFLIAVITGYITSDLGFAGAFFLYAPFYVLGLAYLSVSRPGRRLSRPDARAVLADGLRRCGVLVALSLAVFLFWPRDFQREAMFAQYFDLSDPGERSRVGFTDTLDPERARGADAAVDVLVARIERSGPYAAGPLPVLWRGAALDDVDRRGAWSSRTDLPAGEAFGLERTPDRRGLAANTDPPEPGPRVRVERLASAGRTVFVPAGAAALTLDAQHRRGIIEPTPGGGARYSEPGTLGYVVELAARADDRPAPTRPMTDVPRSAYTASTLDFAPRLAARAGRDATPAQVGREMASYLSAQYGYLPPGHEDAAETLHVFMTEGGGGHCEFFASALAIMLRAEGVPARVVTGFRAHPTEDEGALELRSSGAHAWVEMYDADEGWITLDPTPLSDLGPARPGLLERGRARLAEVWNQVTGFDSESRDRAIEWLRSAPGAAARGAREHPVGTALGAAALAALLRVLRRRRRPPVPAETEALVRGFRLVGHPIRAGETPREALARVRGAGLDPDAIDSLAGAVERHEAARYARSRA